MTPNGVRISVMPDDSPTYLTFSRLIRARTALLRAVDAPEEMA